MNSLNLRNLLLTGSAIVLMLFIMAFPTYLFVEVFQNKGATVFLLVIFAIGSSIYGYCIRQDNFMTTILKLSLFTSTYLLMLATLINYEYFFSISEKFLLLISALYFASMPLFFRNPFIRILTLTVALTIFNVVMTLYFPEIGMNTILILNLVTLVILGLSNYAIRYYTLLIALSLCLFLWSLWQSFGFHYIDVSLTTPTIIYILLGLSFIPHLLFQWKNQNIQYNICYLIGTISILILTYFLPISTIAGILLITISFYLQARTLHVIGILLFISSLFMYYYNLDSTLSTKGIILIITGIIILIMRYTIRYFGKIPHEH
ncbi:DUF4401 domain-containing protein [Wohlfahrtiimonas larvae]|uniref:DUF4401 domain-containing protein n=1 Tax=Wohlfahrtiimonas larvae TaxID=1157986 RepID=A0ABP9MI59_9GAMM|nr:DUF4401 domain-containing protein [Wohlfahrtiimonas larvae]